MKKQLFITMLVLAICSGKANAAEVQAQPDGTILDSLAPAAGGATTNGSGTVNSPDAAVVTSDQVGTYDQDPLEKENRYVFAFNSFVDRNALAPIARGYVDVVPTWGRHHITNILYNLSEPITFVNSVLQADPQNSFTSLWRFIMNSTVGILGTFDVAETFGLEPRKEDFGQTFAVWGWTNSTYLVIPFIGPSTLRDGVGLIGDYYANPFYNGVVFDDYAQYGLIVVDAVDQRANLLPVTDDIDKNALDPYATYRSEYLQHRQGEIDNTEQKVHNHLE